MRPVRRPRPEPAAAGFTLVETLIAMLVLVVGLVSIASLFTVAITANNTASRSTAVTAQATQLLEELQAVSFTDAGLAPGGSLTSDVSGYSRNTVIDGVGMVSVRWQITSLDNQTRFIRVRSESPGPRAQLTRAEFTTIRACTAVANGCPTP